jgi:hypothetical protein
MTQAGLYSGAAFQGAMDLYGAIDWLIARAENGGNYTIVLDKDQAVTPTEFIYDRKTVAITLKSAGGKHTVKFEGSVPAYSLFTVGAGVTFTLEDGVTLEGAQNNVDKSIVRVNGGKFVMNGGALTSNRTSSEGGGVRVNSGTFTMNGGTISGTNGGGVYVTSDSTFTMNGGTISGNGNSGVWIRSGTFTMTGGGISGNSAGVGGGIDIESGTFTMTGGTISGNTAGKGGGVRVYGTFTMSGGTISGNTSNNEGGGGVYVESSSTFIKSGGVIFGSNEPDEFQANKAKDDSRGHAVLGYSKKRNRTARETTAMDSRKNGPSGGWE